MPLFRRNSTDTNARGPSDNLGRRTSLDLSAGGRRASLDGGRRNSLDGGRRPSLDGGRPDRPSAGDGRRPSIERRPSFEGRSAIDGVVRKPSNEFGRRPSDEFVRPSQEFISDSDGLRTIIRLKLTILECIASLPSFDFQLEGNPKEAVLFTSLVRQTVQQGLPFRLT